MRILQQLRASPELQGREGISALTLAALRCLSHPGEAAHPQRHHREPRDTSLWMGRSSGWLRPGAHRTRNRISGEARISVVALQGSLQQTLFSERRFAARRGGAPSTQRVPRWNFHPQRCATQLSQIPILSEFEGISRSLSQIVPFRDARGWPVPPQSFRGAYLAMRTQG
jgi:hypothetical protein